MGYEIADGEHPSIVLADVSRRPEVHAQIIVFANEKGGVGKSTLAFHTTIALARAGHSVLAIDLDRRQRSFSRALEHRQATARSLGVDLPSPQHFVLEQQSGAMLMQEIARVGRNCTKIVIDVPGHDSPIARRAIAMAHKLVTPVNATFIDLDSIAHFNPATMRYAEMGRFTETVSQLQAQKRACGLPEADWVLVKNRVRRNEKKQLERFDEAISQLPQKLGLRLASGLSERVSYRDLFMFGLTHADCADLRDLEGVRVHKSADMNRFVDELDLGEAPARLLPLPSAKLRKPASAMVRYRQSLRAHIGAKEHANTHG
ncbi:MAG: division plane positioning ATPase MipZ [Pontixanthobacter sp.]